MTYRPYPNAERALRNLRRQQAVRLYAYVPRRFALGLGQEGAGGWSEAAVRPSLEHVARGAGVSATVWAASIEQALAVLTGEVQADAIYDPTTDQFYPWADSLHRVWRSAPD